MSAYFDPWRATAIAADVMLVSRATPVAVAQRQSSRLAVLLEAARRDSPLYRERLPHGGTASLDAVPPVGKGELMQRFDDWVSDPRLRLGALRDFVADPARIGEAFEGEFVVWESSGSSGEPALFVQDAQDDGGLRRARGLAPPVALAALARPLVCSANAWPSSARPTAISRARSRSSGCAGCTRASRQACAASRSCSRWRRWSSS